MEPAPVRSLIRIPEGSVILTQLGVIGNLGSALAYRPQARTVRSLPEVP